VAFQQFQDRQGVGGESFEHALRERIGRRRGDSQRIDPVPIEFDPIVEVGAGRPSGLADVSDHLALVDVDALANPACESAEMKVICFVPVGVTNPDHVPRAAVSPDESHRSRSGDVGGGPHGGAVVDAVRDGNG